MGSITDRLFHQYPHGVIRKFPRAFTSLVATSATFANFYTLSTGKHAIILNVQAFREVGNLLTYLFFGEASVQLISDLPVFAGVQNVYSVDDGSLPCLEFEATIMIATEVNALA